MPSDKRNSITAKATGLTFSLFNVASARLVPLVYRSTYNASFMDLPVFSFVSHSSLLTAKRVDLAIACDGLIPFVMEIIRIFRSGYFEGRSACRTVLDLYCCVTG